MADRSLTLVFLGKDAGASATAAELAAKLKTLQEITDKNNKTQAESDKQLKSLEKSFKKADRGMNSLLLTALELGPALIPIGAVGVGAIAGLVPAAAAAGLAFLGLRDAWKAGTLQGTALGRQIQVFSGEFEHLKTVAAGGVMPGFTKALREIQPLFPEINRNIALFSTQLGQIAATAAPGFVRLFLQLQPLFQTFGNLLVQGAAKFDQWATSGEGIKNFVAYVQAQLPAVLSTMGNLVVTVSHLVQGFAPFGSTSLLAIKLLSQAINAIPIGVLQALVPVLAGLALGFKAMKEAAAASAGLALMSAKLESIGVGARAASGVVGTLGKAVGFLGPIGLVAGAALGGLSVIFGRHSQAAQEAAHRTNDLTQALQDGTLRATLYSQIVANGAIPAADKLGISQSTVYDSVTRTGGALADLKAKIYEASGRYYALAAASQRSADVQDPAAYAALSQQLNVQRTALENLSSGVQQAQAEYDKAKQNVAQYAKAQGDAALAADILSGKTATNAAALGLTEDAFINATLAQDKQTKAAATATAAMTVEGNAAGLLTQQFNTLTDAMLGASDANLGFKLANLQLQASLKASSGDLRLTTQAGLQNNQAINQAIRLAEQDGEALTKQEQASKGMTRAKIDGTSKTIADLQALRQSIASYHGNTTEVDGLIRKLQGYNATAVPPKNVNVNDNASSKILMVHGHLADLHDKAVTIRANDQASGTIDYVLNRLATANGSTAVTYIKTIDTGQPHGAGGTLPVMHAAGTNNFAGGWSWVGERGPELLRLPAGTQILSNQDSMALVNGVQHFAAGGTVAARESRYIVLADFKDAASVLSHLYSGVTALSQATAKMITDARLAVAAGASGSLVNTVAWENNSLLYLAGRRADIAQRLKSANNNLVDAQKRFHDEAATVRGAVLGTFNIASTSPNSGTPGTVTPDVGSLINTLRMDVTRAQQFRQTLVRLRRLGLRPGLYQQFAEAGPDSANAQLLSKASGRDVAELNRLYAQLNTVATSVGNTTATALYGAGVQAAQGLVRGLQSQEKNLDAMMRRLANTMVSQLRTSLHIQSPSRVAHGIGANFGQGLVLGLESQQRAVGLSSAAMAMTMVRPYATARSYSGGGTYVTVNVGGSVVTENQLNQSVITAIDQARRWRGSGSVLDA